MALLVATTTAHADGLLQIGDRFPEFSASDQYEVEYHFEPGTRTVLVAFDMAGGKAANKRLAAQGPGFLEDHDAVYVSNVYGMPAIGRYFAFRKMRKYPQRIVLADDEHLLDAFPRKEGRVTVIHLDDSAVVASILFWNPDADPVQDFLQ